MPAPPGPAASSWVWGKELRPPRLGWCSVPGSQYPAPSTQPGLSDTFFSRTTFKEFAEKYGRDQRFRLVQKRKDQEHFFNQFILILKKRDKENRLRLRKMR